MSTDKKTKIVPPKKKVVYYLKNEFLLEEYHKSVQNYEKAHNIGKSQMECLSPGLVNAFMLLVDKIGSAGNWRNYSYVEEMKSEALLALCQAALKYDPTKGFSPFAYYTQVAQNSFISYLSVEKKQSNIRDSLIEAHPDAGDDIKPSFSRQYELLDDHLDGTKTIPSDIKKLRVVRRKMRSMASDT